MAFKKMTQRSRGGRETWRRLREWDRGQADAERLTGQLLRYEGFSSVDPVHPLGGPDGLKDVICTRRGERWIGAAYFPRGQHTLGDIKEKLSHDAEGIAKNQAAGLAFVTNQELSLSQRQELSDPISPGQLDLFHLERIASILDSAPCYGVRLEFLDIEMTREEQVAFIAERDISLAQMRETIERLSRNLEQKDGKERTGPASTATVSPRYVPDGSFGFGPMLHSCSLCRGVYKVNRLLFPSVPLLGTPVITCPHCGHVEKYPE